jgi:sugar phosphate isomerase/epimerase
MTMQRREALTRLAQAGAALALARPALAGETTLPADLGIVIHSYGVRRGKHPASRFEEPLAFLEYCRTLGARGVQTSLGVLSEADAERLRGTAERAEMYLEGIVALPRDAEGVARFEDELRTANACGATTVRTVMLPGRRYETFDTAQQFAEFRQRSWDSLVRARPIIERHGVRLALENHKDWRIDELLDILKRIDCPLVGVCLDTGNSIALLEDPHAVVEAYAPYAFTAHFKDMAVRPAPDGFLLAEVPLGLGLLDLPRVVSLLREQPHKVNLNLEMITRDPLRVPCLEKKYWATFGDLPGQALAAALRMVRDEPATADLPRISNRPLDQQLALEDQNVRQSLKFARERLG